MFYINQFVLTPKPNSARHHKAGKIHSSYLLCSEEVLPDPVPSGIRAIISATFTTVFHSLLHLPCTVYFCVSVLCCLLALSANLVKSGIFLHFLKFCCLEASIHYFCSVFFNMIKQNWTMSFNTKGLVRTDVIQLRQILSCTC